MLQGKSLSHVIPPGSCYYIVSKSPVAPPAVANRRTGAGLCCSKADVRRTPATVGHGYSSIVLDELSKRPLVRIAYRFVLGIELDTFVVPRRRAIALCCEWR